MGDVTPYLLEVIVKELEERLRLLREVEEAARGVMTQMDYETPHHTRLRAALDAVDLHHAGT